MNEGHPDLLCPSLCILHHLLLRCLLSVLGRLLKLQSGQAPSLLSLLFAHCRTQAACSRVGLSNRTGGDGGAPLPCSLPTSFFLPFSPPLLLMPALSCPCI
ncbi:hypothetical protein Cadr_000014897 [Camelus dromedarius]|uniref:Uncharacterized protein n=1 Tax=Camelus dromedarius TaxID=9838 RepID=A0A5N4DP21_CAMDR|nr:hypothetical protein Cadr_000014897 [Camelus dromedarius]